MEDKSLSIDPLGDGSATPSRAPRILARLPRVEIAPVEKITRTDPAEQSLHGRHHATIDAGAQPAGVEDPTATVRFDTFPTDTGYVEQDAAPDLPRPRAAVSESVDVTDEQESWLVRLETAVLPYERWVALAAVIAALCLTLTLLRGKPATPAVESPASGGFASTEAAPGAETPAAKSAVPEVTFPKTTVRAESVASATASGPKGLPPADGPRARLAQTVLPVDASEAIDRPLNVAPLSAPGDGYPRTATAVDPWSVQQGGARR